MLVTDLIFKGRISVVIVAVSASVLFSGGVCAQSHDRDGKTEPKALQDVKYRKVADKNIDAAAVQSKQLREESIKETSFALGVQTGVKWRYSKIIDLLEDKVGKDNLDKTFNFSALTMYDGKVLPPVITQVSNEMDIEERTRAYSVGASYRIIKPAQIINAAPNWRDYLWRQFSAIEDVHPSLLPKNETEQKIWEQWVEKGWEKGVAQANRIFDRNLNRAVRDFMGIVLFKQLAAKGVVSLPRLSEGKVAVQVGDNVLSVDQRLFRITQDSFFHSDGDKWQAQPYFPTSL